MYFFFFISVFLFCIFQQMCQRFGLDGKTVKQQLGKSICLRICKSHSIVTQLPDFIVLYFFVFLFEISLFVLFVFLFKLRQILFSLGWPSTVLVKICININICIVSRDYKLIIITVCQHDETIVNTRFMGVFVRADTHNYSNLRG